MKRLGFGLMRLPVTDRSNLASINREKLNAMVDTFMENGCNYFDTAWLYHNFGSENALKDCVVDRYPRESFLVADKLHTNFVDTKEDLEVYFNKQLEKTGAGYFDYYLLHGIDEEMLVKHKALDTFGFIKAKKEQGLIKHIGFSFHAGPTTLEAILKEHPEMEFVQLQINYLDWENPAIGCKECYELATKYGKPVIVMEPVKGGTLARVPQALADFFAAQPEGWSPASWAIRFPLSLENVMVVLSGMYNMDQVTDNLNTVDGFEPLTEAQLATLHKAVEIMNSSNSIQCTGCAYCVNGCPQNIPISQYFALYNADLQEDSHKGWNPQGTYYTNLTKNGYGKASDCIECGQCEGICPQRLPIIDNLKKVAEYFENQGTAAYFVNPDKK